MLKRFATTLTMLLLTLMIAFSIAPTKTVNAASKWFKVNASATTSFHGKLKWKKKSVSYYKIYRSTYNEKTGASSKYKMIAKISGKKTSFTDKKVKKNKDYDYVIKGYKKGKVKYCGSANAHIGLPRVAFDDYFFAEGKISPTSITIEGGRYSGISPTGFLIYRKDADAPDSEYKKIATCKDPKGFSFDDTTVEAGKEYTYRIRTYRVIKGKTVYGPYESCTKAAVNMFGAYDIEVITPKAETVTKLQVKISPSADTPYNGKLRMCEYDGHCKYVNTPTKEREDEEDFTYPSDDDISLIATKYSLDGVEWKTFPVIEDDVTDDDYIIFDGNQPFYLEFERNTYQDDTSAPPISPEFKYPEKNDGIVKIYGLDPRYNVVRDYYGVPSFFTLDFNSGKGFTVEDGEAVH